MPSNKDRLYVALYARASRPTMPGKEDTYHWALIVGLKIETDGSTGVRYHAKEWPRPEGGSTWLFEERSSRLLPSSMILVRIMVGKVTNRNRLVKSCEIRLSDKVSRDGTVLPG
ncbi:predicted protein [Aspergillus terreus NIH2624]|uniref:Uncharacterized protein n=1 Tax=Aspergillus terreus (strain NIH 2624 / FGSC A1156) TaxID=341663 RepID=Q0D124_ASPTN|nr:uncharacterized protein ATEG_00360 [Aspergillus terreus NIH2624]EAU39006.1 predicted protein [Aspergillus terreus NIH2624]